ncbi:hypothetical protein TNCV_635741 [Trichonephila clavipes]|nr:hypothetical protein TNCV_635741 [Trichonephila clavipes]
MQQLLTYVTKGYGYKSNDMVWRICLELRMFSVKRCTRCHLSISPNELVMRAREHVYHLHCFTCATCNKPLTKGDYFGLREDVIYCRTHYEMLLQYERPYICAQQCLKEEETNNGGGGGVLCDKSGRGRCQDFGHLVPSHLQLPCGMELLPDFQQPRVNGGEDNHPLRTVTAIVKTPGQKGRPRKQKGFLSSSLLIPHRGDSADDKLPSVPSPRKGVRTIYQKSQSLPPPSLELVVIFSWRRESDYRLQFALSRN